MDFQAVTGVEFRRGILCLLVPFSFAMICALALFDQDSSTQLVQTAILVQNGGESDHASAAVAGSLVNEAEARLVDKDSLDEAADGIFTTASIIGKATAEEVSRHSHVTSGSGHAVHSALVPLSPDIVDALESANAVIAEATKGLLGSSLTSQDTMAAAASTTARKLARSVSPPPPPPPPPPVDMTAGDLRALHSADSALADASALLRNEGPKAAHATIGGGAHVADSLAAAQGADERPRLAPRGRAPAALTHPGMTAETACRRKYRHGLPPGSARRD